ncbi:uncharacterized protein LOC128391220 isoform X2 [Panonychus citri]|uniref:uncharacterized protein LOC128391220 isoform X2 n=1 Tax=Panonychus citri TaxID=50023 RepID=UPI002306E354|nr:uncharacterized protein LOC128391220 isoform X2 [Panonychus citri]
MKPFNKINGYRLRPMKPIMSTPTTTINILDEDDEDEICDDDEDEEGDDNDNDNEDIDEENALLFEDDAKNGNVKTNRSKKLINRKKCSLSFKCLSKSSDRRRVNLSSLNSNDSSLDDNGDCDSTLTIGKIKIIKPVRRKQRVRLKLCSICFTLIILLISIFLFVYLLYTNQLNVVLNLLIKLITMIVPSSLLTASSSSSQLTNHRPLCDQISVNHQWNQTFPMLTIESALRLIDVNQDDFLDTIIAFGTGADVASYPPVVCQVYFNLTEDQSRQGCGGGLMALDGKTGKLIWNQYTRHELFAVNCELDVTGDSIKDCICGGRMASMYAINGASGEIIWSYLDYEDEAICGTSNFYTPLYISKDLDSDGLSDLVLSHGGDPLRSPHDANRLVARLMIVSSGTGKILSWAKVPDGGESYYSPQQLIRPDGTELILFGTGGETHPGSLWIVPLDSLIHGNMHKAHPIYTDCCKGIMVPPVLVDINSDSILDIIMSLFNSTVIAFDGHTFHIIWQYHFPGSETYSSPTVGYFNADRVPDFFVSYQFGPGFPIYYYSQANVLDGLTGKPLLSQPISMLVGTQSSPLTISTNGANDIFLFWLSTCDNVNQSVTNLEPFKVLPGTTVHQASRADFCSIRFNSTLYTQLIGLTPNGSNVIYDSRLNKQLESVSIDYAAIGQQWLQEHQYNPIDQDDPYDSLAQSIDFQQQQQQQQPLSSTQQSVNPSSILDYVRSEPLDYQQVPDFLNNKQINQDRFRRHVGVHDGNGVQRVISTGTLAPSKSPNSIDLIFSTFWFPPTKGVNRISKKMQNCLDKYLNPEKENKLRLGIKSSLKGFDHDGYVEIIEETCAKAVGINLTKIKEDYNPYNRPMGSMTVYRKTIKCINTTAWVRPFKEQIWPSYMGKHVDCLANLIPLD